MRQQWTENGTPLVPPDARFREELHRALQDTHQRQQVQRQLHSGHKSQRSDRPGVGVLLAALSLLALVFGLGYYLRRHTHSPG